MKFKRKARTWNTTVQGKFPGEDGRLSLFSYTVDHPLNIPTGVRSMPDTMLGSKLTKVL